MQRFAEAKNAALLLASISSLALLFGIVFGKDAPEFVKLYGAISFVAYPFAIFFAAQSFLPKSKPRQLKATEIGHPAGLVFYGDLVLHSPETYAEKLNESSFWGGLLDPIERDIVEQIIINARITNLKMNSFKAGMYAFVFALFTPALGIPLLLVHLEDQRRFNKGLELRRDIPANSEK